MHVLTDTYSVRRDASGKAYISLWIKLLTANSLNLRTPANSSTRLSMHVLTDTYLQCKEGRVRQGVYLIMN